MPLQDAPKSSSRATGGRSAHIVLQMVPAAHHDAKHLVKMEGAPAPHARTPLMDVLKLPSISQDSGTP